MLSLDPSYTKIRYNNQIHPISWEAGKAPEAINVITDYDIADQPVESFRSCSKSAIWVPIRIQRSACEANGNLPKSGFDSLPPLTWTIDSDALYTIIAIIKIKVEISLNSAIHDCKPIIVVLFDIFAIVMGDFINHKIQ